MPENGDKCCFSRWCCLMSHIDHKHKIFNLLSKKETIKYEISDEISDFLLWKLLKPMNLLSKYLKYFAYSTNCCSFIAFRTNRRGHSHGPPLSFHSPWGKQHLHQNSVCWFQLSIQHNLPHEAVRQTEHSGSEYHTLHLDVGPPHKQTPDSSDWRFHLVRSVSEAPQGSVFSPLPFIPYTHACNSWHGVDSIVNFTDDSTIIGWISNSFNFISGGNQQSPRVVQSKQPKAPRQ